MRWSKIKNIIILMLVIVNVSLLAMVGIRTWHTRRSREELRVQMAAVLEKNGISFLPDEMPGEMPLDSLRLTVELDEDRVARAFLPDGVAGERVGSRVTYTSGQGWAELFNTGEISVRYAPDANREEKELLAAVEEAVPGVHLSAVEREPEEAGGTAVYTLLWGEERTPLPDRTLTLRWEGGSLAGVTGRLLGGTAEVVSTGREAVDAPTALARFLEALNREGYVCSQVTDMYAGYAASGTDVVTLTPAWYVETDTGRFAVDGYTGAVTAG